MTVAPWSTSVHLRWKPSVRYFHGRYEALDKIEQDIGVAAYHFDDEIVGARLDVPGLCEIVMRPGRLELSNWLPEGSWDHLMHAARLSLPDIGPSDPPVFSSVAVFTQFLLAVDQDKDSVIRGGVRNLLTDWTDRVPVLDFALLFDLRYDDPSRAGQVEFGIVSSEEIPARLGRFVGRMGANGPGRSEQVVNALDVDDLPEVAFFCDSSQFSRHLGRTVDELEPLCREMVGEAGSVVAELFATTMGSSGRPVQRGTGSQQEDGVEQRSVG